VCIAIPNYLWFHLCTQVIVFNLKRRQLLRSSLLAVGELLNILCTVYIFVIATYPNMAEVKAGNTTLPLTIDNGRARELETRYIELLEKRISVLERLLEEEKPAVGLLQEQKNNQTY